MRIDFYNRDGNDIWLEEVGDNGWWLLRINHNLLPYVRLLLEEEGEGIYAVDPPGGPFISVGSKARSYVVREIKQTSMGIFLRLEKGD